jgi:L-fuculose-phosphate aldolase
MNMQQQRAALLEISLKLSSLGLNRGTSGNASVRANNEAGQAGFLITPSGMAVEEMTADDMVWMDFSAQAYGQRKPSTFSS